MQLLSRSDACIFCLKISHFPIFIFCLQSLMHLKIIAAIVVFIIVSKTDCFNNVSEIVRNFVLSISRYSDPKPIRPNGKCIIDATRQ